MTNEEALETIQIAIAEAEWNYPLDYAIALEKAAEALDKRTPKKPLIFYSSEPPVIVQPIEKSSIIAQKPLWCCPSCGKYYAGLKINYCDNCGEAIDWSKDD